MQFWRSVGEQLRRPTGRSGRMAGAAMRWINREPYRLAIAALEVRPSDDVLELGFGPGEGVHALASLAPDGVVWGVDHSPTMLGQAAARNRQAIGRDRVRLRCASFTALPLDDGSIDRVLAVNVAYFWGDGGAVMREIGRVLKPGGRLSVYVTAAAAMQGWDFAGSATHRTFTAGALLSCLAQPPFDLGCVRVAKRTLPFDLPALLAVAER